ncbi:MAG: 16S rRNA (uracil(1498)-N(3))-methyltransferase [Acidobacteria bacterium]|nr:16S rRNA (uracil(1498)-N(3))-methyltransferase [Acidobacteriota bacterium]
MTRRRFYVPRDSIKNGTAHLSPDQSHHLHDVLRIGAGETVEIFDGEGTGYVGEVSFRDSVVVIHHLKQLLSEPPGVPLILAAALIKPAKFEWILQKATELGVHEIIPVKTRRSEIKIPRDKVASRHERWNRIVREASKQCRRFSAPRVRPPLDYSDMLQYEEFSVYSKLLFYENADGLWRPETVGASGGVVLCIGPEGGWEDIEIEEARRAGYRIFSLGPWILRAETAAVAAVSIVQYHINLQRSADSSGKNPLI